MRRNLHPEVLSLALALVASYALADDSSFKAMDADKDGKVTVREHADAARRMFTTMDANRDGSVTAAEMDAAQYKISGRPATVHDLSAADKIKAVDGNGDGALGAAEHAAGSSRMFEAMDANHDGVLTQDELDAGHARLLKK